VPSQETFQVVVGVTGNTTAKLQVFDSRGQFVHQEDIISKEGTRIEVLNLPSNFPAGIYWLRLLMGDQNLTKKLLIR
jgi:uncharacterized protein YfaS (alpha-2-macroglobulin family)